MKKKKILGFIAGLMMIPLINGCNSFFNTGNENTGNGIHNITHQLVAEGVEVTIYYDDDSMEPLTFIIPQGTAGVDGNSIDHIELGNDQNNNPIIIIYYTNPGANPSTVPIPLNKGIDHITPPTFDSDGNTVITVVYTDGTESNPITIYKGDTGISVVDIIKHEQPDGSVELDIVMSDGNNHHVTVPAPNTGNGIEYIETNENENEYILIVHYTNGDEQSVSFNKPNRWYQVYAKPSSADGNNGDYAFDMVAHVIYAKQNGVWVIVADLNTSDSIVTYSVTFDLNGAGATLSRGELAYSIPSGKTFYSESHIMPEATRQNFDFLGWSTVKEPTAVNGWFTDLTPVVSDMTLYAIWKAQ